MKNGLTSNRQQNPKNWSIYFLEFLLIFLAVTLGFFAESIRERIGDEDKEKEFIASMMEDAATDTIHIQEAISLNTKRMLALDSLAEILSSYKPGVTGDYEIYRLYRKGLNHPVFVSPTERTMTQLKNSGGMRLIRKKAAVEVIVKYDDMAKNLVDQQAFYELYQNASIEMAVKLLDFRYFKFRAKDTSANNEARLHTPPHILTHDKLKLIEFGNRVNIYQGVVKFYIVRLEEMKKDARNLIGILKKEYELGD